MPTRVTEGEKTLIRVLYVEKRKTHTQIAEMMDRPKTTVNLWIRKLGIKRTDELVYCGKVYKRLTQDQEQAICAAIQNGELPSEMAREYNISVSRVVSVMERHGVQGPVQTLGYHYTRSFTPGEDQQIRRRVESGESRRSIAKEYGVKPTTITNACVRAGMTVCLSSNEQAKRNKACERIAVRSTLSIEQTARSLDCSEKLVRQARIRHAKNPSVVKSPDADEQKILNSLNVEPHILTGLYGGSPVQKTRTMRAVIVSDLPQNVQSEIIRLRMEGKLVNEIASILKIDMAEVRTTLQSKWCKVKTP